jgi:transcriptional regulator GlxA family with amidase domain
MLDRVDSADIVAQNKRCQVSYQGYPWRTCEEIHPFQWRRSVVQAIQSEIEASLSQPIRLAQLGRIAGCGRFTLLRLFRASVGISPHEYQFNLRLRLAKSLLRKGLQIAEVAAETGFFDQSHFTTSFRTAFGLTPGRYLQAQYFPISEEGLDASIPPCGAL